MLKQQSWFALWPLLWAAGAGCNKEGSGPKTYPVQGVVSYHGAPVAGAIVVFRPSGDGNRGASAQTDTDGRYTLTTFTAGDGAIAGDYVVIVQKTSSSQNEWTKKISETKFHSTKEYEDFLEKNKIPPGFGVKQIEHVPRKYTQEKTSPLRATVVADGSPNNFDFPLKD